MPRTAPSDLAKGARQLPALQRRSLPVGRQLCLLAPAAGAQRQDPRPGPAQLAPAVHRPTGTISLAFADNASNGIEPAFSWSYTRKKRLGRRLRAAASREYAVEDHAWRLYRHLFGLMRRSPMPSSLRARTRRGRSRPWSRRWRPFIDTSISKTVNVPADYPYEDFQDLYTQAWRSGSRAWPPTGPTACSDRCCRSRRKSKQPEPLRPLRLTGPTNA